MTEVSQDQKQEVAKAYRTIAELLKHGLFFGSTAQTVADAVRFLEQNAQAAEAGT